MIVIIAVILLSPKRLRVAAGLYKVHPLSMYSFLAQEPRPFLVKGAAVPDTLAPRLRLHCVRLGGDSGRA